MSEHADLAVRLARTDELDVVSDLTVQSYLDGAGLEPDSEYLPTLRRARDRAAASPLYVAVRDDVVVGALSVCPYGSLWSEIAEPGEVELRMLVVARSARGTGVADALLAAADAFARERGDHALVLSVIRDNAPAHRLYARHGFLRIPERDWDPTPEAHLLTYTRAV
ncbi:MAG TPA: GNAT family N-acetyltransferase [Candidatus Limnocylindria bacterium]|nr:GNAT family N-acetyltransferase [Candidatus Limnocylindria bacterium]